jgi:transcriptional regulator with PAS, ATPase and Fis domain
MRHPVPDERAASTYAADLLEAVVEGLEDGLVVVGGDGVVLHLNGAAERFLGLRREHAIGRLTRDLPAALPWTLASEALARGAPVAGVQQPGGPQTLLVSARPVAGGRVVLSLRDVSETSRLMARFQRTGERARPYRRDPDPRRDDPEAPPRLIARSDPLRRARETAVRYAAVELPVLLLGETGTGKGLFAELVHQASERRTGPFLEINCGAIPEALMEAELFGYARGAFTGADARGKAGLVELAEGGTLLLDEIGDLPPALQVKLLRFLETGEVRPVGAVRGRRLDVRIVAATHRNLAEMIDRGTFRADLFYRLNVLTIQLPPLREHPEDIPWLVEMMLERVGQRLRRRLAITPAALERLAGYRFPGNVRELWNLVERLGVSVSGDTIEAGDLPPEVTATAPAGRPGGVLREAVQRVEATLLREALARYGTQDLAARYLGVGQATIARKARRYGLSATRT